MFRRIFPSGRRHPDFHFRGLISIVSTCQHRILPVVQPCFVQKRLIHRNTYRFGKPGTVTGVRRGIGLTQIDSVHQNGIGVFFDCGGLFQHNKGRKSIKKIKYKYFFGKMKKRLAFMRSFC